MTLEGTLEAFGVADVLEMLAGAAKSGRLRVEGDGGRAVVRLHDGAVIAAASDRASGSPLDEVICDLLRYERGSFAFEADDGAAGGDGDGNGRGPGRAGRAGGNGHDAHVPVSQLLARAGTLLAERRELEAIVPSLEHRVGLTERLADGDHVTISAEQWPVLVAVGAGCTVGELATTLQLSELATLRTVRDLVTAGLTTVRAAGPRAGWKARNDADPPPRPRHARDAPATADPWDAGSARDTRDPRQARHAWDGRRTRYDEANEAGEAEDARPWRPPGPELERDPDQRWPDPPPLGSRS